MKINKMIAAIALTSIVMVSCKNENPKEEATVTTEQTQDQPAQLATASFSIEGMHCEVGCAGVIQKKLAKLEGVQDAKVDFAGKTATITYDANKQTPEIMVQTVQNISDDYKVSNVTSVPEKTNVGT
ncbi:cation transporter [Flavobacterium sp.]|jgi:mercuric ion binding protein|uniref:cation transporter n=1 Tax=Flavobacterium sp. TaxID=239 RepID=UPI0037BF7BAC